MISKTNMIKNVLSISLAALAFGCAVDSQKASPKASSKLECGGEGLASKHAEISARASAQAFSGCFQNYLKLNPQTEAFKVKFCAHIKTDSQGAPRRASLKSGSFNGDMDSFPNDLRWCLEQQLWKLNFSGLQFEAPQILSFPLAFEVRK